MHFMISCLLLLLVNCSEKEEAVTNPAAQQITEYTQNLDKECDKEKKQENSKQQSDESSDARPQKPEAINPWEVSAHDIVLGSRDSKVTVIEYISPTCPHCAYFHREILPKLQEQYIKNNKISYVIRNFIANKLDLDASVLAYCSGDQEKFLKFTNIILQQQESWALSNKYREILANIGGLGGVSAEQYAKCLQDDALLEFLWANSKAATKSPKFIGTPAFFINGVQFMGAYSITALSSAIDEALKKTQEQPKSE
jgi:protein-disulfide isomerase